MGLHHQIPGFLLNYCNHAIFLLQVPLIKFDKDGGIVSEGEVKTPSVEEYVGELLSRIQPAPASEHRRKTVAQYVQDIIAKAFQPTVEASFRLTWSWGRLHCAVAVEELAVSTSLLPQQGCKQTVDFRVALSSTVARGPGKGGTYTPLQWVDSRAALPLVGREG